MSIIEKAVRAGKSKQQTESEAPKSPQEALQQGDDFLDGPSTVLEPDDLLTSAVRPSTFATAPESRIQLDISMERLQHAGFISPNVPRSRIAEEFRTIKRPLLRNIDKTRGSFDEQSNLIMVTSALQGDGKTFSSINLAISIAMEQDKTVLFVDADVVRASAGKTLGIPKGTPGLIDLLDDNSDVDPADVILHTNIPKLRVLPAGNGSDNSTELLASDTMHQFMIELSNRYHDRVIVFDSPPLLLTTEAGVLASFMGQIVFVASADVTPQHAVQEALEHIGENKIAGVVLNRASRRRSKLLGVGSYGYGYGYGDGYGYGERRGSGAKIAADEAAGQQKELG
ncbi:XrtA-associated tyrosine autokinase [Congregibacter brevis]|uniref:non-specific protein-tyrosine kinase n=1 Tax=Congregibacter brevis TaxID=3081201 RepID=A0ABZ0IFF7_9GAMM|nr:XrtA-associated tyrosine autokinase [Congregibacter sp. IMCC45268]